LQELDLDMAVCDMIFSQQWIWRWLSCGMCYRIIW